MNFVKCRARKSPEKVAGLAARTKRVIAFYGGQKALAEKLGMAQPSVWGWATRGFISWKGASRLHEIAIEEGEGFTASWIRPDLIWKGSTLISKYTHGNDYHEPL